jgi:hypothetical protein
VTWRGAAARQGDAQQNPYYCGLMFGLEIACDELAQIVDDALHTQLQRLQQDAN